MLARRAAALSASSVLLAGAAYAPLAAAPADTSSATGAASSSLALVDVAIGDTRARALELVLRSGTTAGAPTTSAVLTPLTVGQTAFGRQELRTRSAVLPSVNSADHTPASVSGVVAARSPQVSVSVDGGASRAAASSLGGLTVLGLPLAVDGQLEISSDAGAAGTAGAKTLSVRRLALPTVADLLAAQGLDVPALPADLLAELLQRLDLHTSITRDAQAALDAAVAQAGAAVAAANAQVAAAGTAVTTATQERASAQTQLTSATRALNEALAGLGGLRLRGSLAGLDPLPLEPALPVATPLPVPAVTDSVVDAVGAVDEAAAAGDAVLDAALAPVLEPALTPVAPVTEVVEQLPLPALPGSTPSPVDVTAVQQAYDAAVAAVAAADAAVATATAALADAQAALRAALAPHAAQVQELVRAATDVLARTPLVSLDRLEVSTRSAVTSASAGGQTARIVGGEVEGLRVLGTDVLDAALGTSSLDVLDLTGSATTAVDAEVARLMGALSDVLSNVPGLPGLQVPAPTVQLLSRTTATDVVDGFGVAGSALRALTVSWPAVTVPAAAAVPGAATLPAVVGLPSLPSVGGVPSLPSVGGGLRVASVGDVLTQPISISVGTLEDRARFRPAASASQGDGSGTESGAGTDGATGGSAPVTSPGVPAAGQPETGAPGVDVPAVGTPDDAPPAEAVAPPAQPRTTPVGLRELPRTGAPSAPALLALALVAAAVALRRRAA